MTRKHVTDNIQLKKHKGEKQGRCQTHPPFALSVKTNVSGRAVAAAGSSDQIPHLTGK
jgi:hypothetical protein